MQTNGIALDDTTEANGAAPIQVSLRLKLHLVRGYRRSGVDVIDEL